MDRALAYGAKCYRFKSYPVHFRGVAQPGSVPGLEPGGRQFESDHPD